MRESNASKSRSSEEAEAREGGWGRRKSCGSKFVSFVLF